VLHTAESHKYIWLSTAAIYLACQLEEKRKTEAQICKVTGPRIGHTLTLRKVYKELLGNWDDLLSLPPDYTPATPPEKAFPRTSITQGAQQVYQGSVSG